MSFQVLLQTIERIPTTGTQLKILATVKATMFGTKGIFTDLEIHLSLFEFFVFYDTFNIFPRSHKLHPDN